MTLTSKIKPIVDRPVWEWCRFLPSATSVTSGFCYGEGLNERYLYYIVGAFFFRYDLITDTYTQLQGPNTTPVSFATMKYSSYGGYRGNVLDATTNTLTISGLEADILTGQKIRITAGTGMGQERTILSATETQTLDHGIITAIGGTNASISDSTKKWNINQYIGYQVRIVYNTGISQVRKVLYNDATTLYFYDINYQQLDPWNNTGLSSVSPYALPVVTAGSQAHYYIEQSVITVDSNWTIMPDDSSSYVVMSGGIWLFSSTAAAPWSSLQYYDVISDTWFTKTALCGLVTAAYGTDATIERTGEYSGAFDSGTATSATARTLVNSSKTMTVDQFDNYQIRITGGTGLGQRRRITQNNATTFWIESNWDITPDATSTYEIYGNTDRMYLFGGGLAATLKYNIEKDIWLQGNSIDFGIANNGAVIYNGQEPFGITSISRNTGSILTINTTPVAGGTGYVVGEVITLGTGASGQVKVTSIAAGGVVTGLELYASGNGYSVATAAQSATTGTGTGCTCAVTSIGVTGFATLATNHNLCKGDSVTVKGASEGLWNVTGNVISTNSLTTFWISTTATASFAAANSQSTTVLVDATKNWTVNEHVGRLVMINTAGPAGTTQIRRITANTATTLTLQSAITAAVNGTSRYVITSPQAFGRAIQYKVPSLSNEGKATGGSTTTLIDSTKNWVTSQWVGYKFRITSGTGVGSEIAITANTATTLTYATQTFTPDATTDYIIMDSFGLMTAATNATNATITDTTKNWTVNMWAGKRLRVTSGAGAGQEITITSNTATVLTCSGVFATAPGTDSTYTILECGARGAGINANWIHGTSKTVDRGRYIFVPRGGGSNVFDRYDITNETWDITALTSPQTEVLNTGSQYAYDGGDYIYIQFSNTGRIGRLNVRTFKVEGSGQIPYSQGTAIIGNRMEIIQTEDDLHYLYIARNSGQELFRTLIFW